MEAAKKQQAFFQQHLQELTLFKAKTSAALLQVRCRKAAARTLLQHLTHAPHILSRSAAARHDLLLFESFVQNFSMCPGSPDVL